MVPPAAVARAPVPRRSTDGSSRASLPAPARAEVLVYIHLGGLRRILGNGATRLARRVERPRSSEEEATTTR